MKECDIQNSLLDAEIDTCASVSGAYGDIDLVLILQSRNSGRPSSERPVALTKSSDSQRPSGISNPQDQSQQGSSTSNSFRSSKSTKGIPAKQAKRSIFTSTSKHTSAPKTSTRLSLSQLCSSFNGDLTEAEAFAKAIKDSRMAEAGRVSSNSSAKRTRG